MTTFISYALLNSGQWQRLPPDSVDDTLVAMARAWLDEDGHHDDIMPGLGLDFLSTRRGSSAFCTLQRAGETIAEFTIVKRSTAAKAAWRDIHEAMTGLPTARQDPPPAPWVGLVFLPAMRQYPQAVMLTAVALAKASAWAWIEKE